MRVGVVLAWAGTLLGLGVGMILYVAASLGTLFGATGLVESLAAWWLGWAVGLAGAFLLMRRKPAGRAVLVAAAIVQASAALAVGLIIRLPEAFLYAVPAALFVAAGVIGDKPQAATE